MEPERRNEEDVGRILEARTTLDEYFDDFFAGANPSQPQWLTLPPLPAVSSVPTTPAASNVPLTSDAPPPAISLPRSAPPQRMSLPPIAVPLTLPPSCAPAAPETPPLRRRRLQASPITPALGLNNESTTRSHSAPCTPANSTMVSPVTPSSATLLGGLVGEEQYAPSAELARFVCSRVAGTDSTPQYEALLKEVAQFVENMKCNMRERLREQFEREKGVLTPKERTRFRSRRGAAVSRFKVVHTKQTLEQAAVWCVVHLACPANTSTSAQSSEDNTSFGAPSTSNAMHSPSSPPHTSLLSPPTSSLGSMATLSVAQAVSPRTELANTLTSLSLRTPSNITSTHSPYTPPVMSLPPAKSMLSPEAAADDALLSTVTKVPIGTEVVGGIEFRLSAELQTALLSRRCVTEVDMLMERVRAEVKQFVEEKKGLVREEYKTRLNEMKEKLTAKSRMRGRSRRGAAVTRFKNSATIGAWEDSLRWFIDNIYAPETTTGSSSGTMDETGLQEENARAV